MVQSLGFAALVTLVATWAHVALWSLVFAVLVSLVATLTVVLI